MAESGPLAFLRDSIQRGETGELEGDKLVFGDISFNADVETTYKSNLGKGPNYSLKAVWFFMKHAETLTHTNYIQECRTAGMPLVSFVDRKGLLNWMAEGSRHIAEDLNLSEPEPKRQKVEGIDIPKESLPVETPARNKTTFVEDDAPVTRGIVENERLLEGKSSFMQIPKRLKRDFSNVVHILDQTKAKMEAQEKAGKEKLQKEAEMAVAKNQQYSRYNVEEKDFWKDRLMGGTVDEFQIVTTGTHLDVQSESLNKPITTPAAPQAPKPEPKPKPKPKPAPTESARPAAPAVAVPIIILPTAVTSLITAYNIADFLENGHFVPAAEKRKAGKKPTTPFLITRTLSNGCKIQYQIVDNIKRLSRADWARVVSVFALGPAWQFKDWPNPDPVMVFSQVLGVHVKWADVKIDPNVSRYNIKVLEVSRQNRHLDKIVVYKFWQLLDAQMQGKPIFSGYFSKGK
eukprot:GCRY01002136.1.p1 GENE.GCRY01002136.1~~GCRY01002136.1.p1  ORF type:complete len:460 (-),score=80.91 GCRY01002136.1:47-1426(-)